MPLAGMTTTPRQRQQRHHHPVFDEELGLNMGPNDSCCRLGLGMFFFVRFLFLSTNMMIFFIL
jgi:hypothetical protein